jgi:hypothetical protein
LHALSLASFEAHLLEKGEVDQIIKMEKHTSQTPSQRSTSTDDHTPKHDFVETESGDEPPKKKWYQKLNPFLAGEVPPIPVDAGMVPDLHANWWNKLTWGWMAPIMMVIRAPNPGQG